jgi:hypothetical protein
MGKPGRSNFWFVVVLPLLSMGIGCGARSPLYPAEHDGGTKRDFFIKPDVRWPDGRIPTPDSYMPADYRLYPDAYWYPDTYWYPDAWVPNPDLRYPPPPDAYAYPDTWYPKPDVWYPNPDLNPPPPRDAYVYPDRYTYPDYRYPDLWIYPDFRYPDVWIPPRDIGPPDYRPPTDFRYDAPRDMTPPDINPFGPDLVITNVVPSVSSTTSYNYVRYSVTVCNYGSVTAPSVDINVYYNQPNPPAPGVYGDNLQTVGSSLSPGSCRTRTITRGGTPAGTYTSWVQIDVANVAKEANESNNIYGPVKVAVAVSTPGADLAISSFTYRTYGSSSVQYRTRVCNVGTGQSGATELHVYYNQRQAPPPGLPGDQATTVNSLAPGACTNRSIYRSGTPSGTYASWVQLDPYNTLKELKEDNNIAGPLIVTR